MTRHGLAVGRVVPDSLAMIALLLARDGNYAVVDTVTASVGGVSKSCALNDGED